MSWTGPDELRGQVQKLWDRGELLASLVAGDSLFPKRLTFRVPTSAEMSERFDEVRGWITALRAMPYCRMEMREFRHRLFGANAVPQSVWIETFDDAVAILGKTREVAVFVALIDSTRARQPPLLEWLAREPLRALELAGEWSRLLDIVAWIQRHPRPGVYLRQVDIPGIHTKFIEARHGVLGELLDIALAADAIDSTVPGATRFAKRYGFRDKPARIRFRTLDPVHALFPGSPLADITVDIDTFARLDPKVSLVFITENEVNFLAFPPVRNSLVIFGAGYGFVMLSNIAWLARSRICYWGDIDTHGFAILDQLRSHFPRVESFLMDRATLLAFESVWGEEQKQTLRDLPRLDSNESALYDDLRDNRLRKNLRLEQEMIGFNTVKSVLSALFDQPFVK